jgi:hypothetical protein
VGIAGVMAGEQAENAQSGGERFITVFTTRNF